MIKRLLLAALFSIAAVPAFAACSNPVTVKDGSGSNVSMSVATGADTNCQSKIDVDTASVLYGAITASVPAGTNLIGKVGIDQTTPGTTNGVQVNAALPAGTNNVGKVTPNDGTNSRLYDPCQTVTKVYTPISQTANTKLVSGTSSKKTYVCSIFVLGADAENVSLIEGTGSTCGTNPVAVIGGATAANGANMAANGGFTHGNGGGAIAATSVNADDLCLFQSGSGRVAGVITTVQQ